MLSALVGLAVQKIGSDYPDRISTLRGRQQQSTERVFDRSRPGIRRGKDLHTDMGAGEKGLGGRSGQFLDPVRINPNRIRYADAFGSQNGLLGVCTIAGKEGLQERGDAKALFATFPTSTSTSYSRRRWIGI